MISLKAKLISAKLISAIAAIGTILFVGLAVSYLFAYPIKWTWNATMPYIFALPTITWGKAWCLSFLSGAFLKSSSNIKD